MSIQRNILIADSDREARAALADDLIEAGHSVSQTGSGGEAMAIVLNRLAKVDLLMLRTDLVDSDGCEVVSRLRRRGAVLPIVLVSDSAGEDDVVEGLDAGADDFIVRPLRPRELAARLRVQLRAGAAREEAELRIGPILFRPASRTLTHPDLARPLKLTEKESGLLLRLYRAEGRPISRQTLLREVWGYSPEASSHTVETHIYRLRRKIEPTPQSPALLVSETGGYRLRLESALAPVMAGGDMPTIGWTPALPRPALPRPALPRPAAMSSAIYRMG